MGRAIVVSNVGEGLYTVRLEYDLTALIAELARLNAAEADYAALILRTMATLAMLKNDAAAAKDAVAAIIDQWKNDLIGRGNENPGPLEPENPIDPETGLPWVNPDKAQEGPLLDAINAMRASASVDSVTRDAALDNACLFHLRDQAYTGAIGHIGSDLSTPINRATFAGYINPVTLYELLAYGPITPAAVVATWQRDAENAAHLIDASIIKAGISHVYSNRHAGSYLWAVLLASAETTGTSFVIDDPAKTSSENTEGGLARIDAPNLDDLTPEKLGEAVRLFALAQNKVIAADREVARLMAERLQRLARIDLLETLLETTEIVFHAWACQYVDDLAIGAAVKTAEVPGHWDQEDAIMKTSRFGVRNDPYGLVADYDVPYTERQIQLIPPDACDAGQLRHAETLSDAAIFIDACIEPGHLKWKPLWRYGAITAIAGNYCDLLLDAVHARPLPGRNPPEDEMALDDILALTAVPISYPPCNGEAFRAGDEVLVLFEGHHRDAPKVIGFRREPRPCPEKRTWRQLV